jgi:hypothetical protein
MIYDFYANSCHKLFGISIKWFKTRSDDLAAKNKIIRILKRNITKNSSQKRINPTFLLDFIRYF